MFEGKLHRTEYSNASFRRPYWPTAEHDHNQSGSKFYEHCWCVSNSNCSGSVGIYGVWKANKFLFGCKKCLSMEFCILTEYSFQFPYLCNAWYFIDVRKMIYVTLS